MADERSVVLLIGADSSQALREFERVKSAARVASGEIGGIGAAAAGGAGGVDVLAASGVRLDQSLRRSGAAVRALSVPLLSELGPAMGQTASRVAGVLGAAASLGGGMGALAVAAGGLAGILVGKLIGGFSESERGARGLGNEIRTDAKAFDDLAEKITTASGKLASLQALTSKIDPRIARQLEGPLSPGRRLGRQQAEMDTLFGELDTLLRARQESKVDVEGTFGGGPAFAKLTVDLRALNEARARAASEAGVREQEFAAAAVNRERQRVVAGLQAAREILESEKALEESRRSLLGETASATRDFYAERLSLARVQADELTRLAEQETAAQLRGFDVQIADKRRQLSDLRNQPGFAGDFTLQRQAVDLAADATRMEAQKVEAASRGAAEIRKLNEDLTRDIQRLDQERTREALTEIQNRLNATRAAFQEMAGLLKQPPAPGAPAVMPAADPLRGILLQMGSEGARGGETDPSAFRVIRQAEERAAGKVSLRSARELAEDRLREAETGARTLSLGGSVSGAEFEAAFDLQRRREQVTRLRMPGAAGLGLFGVDPAEAATQGRTMMDAIMTSISEHGEKQATILGRNWIKKFGLGLADSELLHSIADEVGRMLGQALLERASQSGF